MLLSLKYQLSFDEIYKILVLNVEVSIELVEKHCIWSEKGRNMILDVNIGGTMYGIDLGTAKVNVVAKTYGTSATGSSDGA